MFFPIVQPMLNGDMSRKSLWLAAFVSALSRLSPAEAHDLADEALRIGDARWRAKNSEESITTWTYKESFPVGHPFKE